LVLAIGLTSPKRVEAQFVVQNSVFGNGGAVIENERYHIVGTVGQPVIGTVSSASNIISVGLWYLCDGKADENYGAITVSKAGDYGGGSTTPGSTNVPLLQLEVVTDAGTATISAVKTSFTSASTAVDGDISLFKVYHDADGDGTVSDGDNFLGSATFTSSVATVTGLSFDVTTTSKKLLLVLDISSGANATHKVGLNLASSSYITASNGTVADTNFPISNSGDKSLPVELVSFNAVVTTAGVTLHWLTETEVNNIGFAIYRGVSQDGLFEKIGWIDGAGNSAMPNEYQFTDKTAQPGHTYFYYLEDVDIEGIREKSKIIQIALPEKPSVVIPSRNALLQNYPNPFNPDTWIPFELAQDADVVIKIYEQLGKLIRNIDLGRKEAGYYTNKTSAVYWDGRNDAGESVASGIYFYSIKAGEFTATKKLLILK
jgi:hypothetical protein